jgi:cardiolipin synthase
MIGTANLDMRSLWLNYEISMFVYDAGFTRRLRSLQTSYLEDCNTIDRQAWMSRRFVPRFVENAFRLVSPLL